MARILVGIPTRNRPEYLRQTVMSVLAQSMPDFRLIVSENPGDPGVAADNAAWIASLGDARVSYVLQPIDGGEYGQGRYLFGQCDEPYFCLIHDDDLMDQGYLEEALGRLDAHPALALFASSQHLIDAQGMPQPDLTEQYSRFQGRDRYPEGPMPSFLEPLLEYGVFSISGAVFRADPVRSCGVGDPDMGGLFPFEFNMFLRVAERGLGAWYTPRRLIAYRWHQGSIRQTHGAFMTRYMVEAMVELLRRRRFEGRAERLRRRLLAYNLRNLGYILLVACERRAARACLAEAIGLHPLGPTMWLRMVAAWLTPGWIARRWQDRVSLAEPSPSWKESIPARSAQ